MTDENNENRHRPPRTMRVRRNNKKSSFFYTIVLLCGLLVSPSIDAFAPSHQLKPISRKLVFPPSSQTTKPSFLPPTKQLLAPLQVSGSSEDAAEVSVPLGATSSASTASRVETTTTTHSKTEVPSTSYRAAIKNTLLWVMAACIFGGSLWLFDSPTTGEEFFAGYLVEQSLSVDNLFVFLILFEYFQIPASAQNRILSWGIFGAIVMRAIMIGLGAVALQSIHSILLVFAGILLYSSAKILWDVETEEDPSDNVVVKFSKNLIASTDVFDGDKFFTVIDGVKTATPLFICMIAVEISDIVFAVDSIPAVFGVTEVRWSLLFDCVFSLSGYSPCFLLSCFLESPGGVFIQHLCDYGTAEPLYRSEQGGDGPRVS